MNTSQISTVMFTVVVSFEVDKLVIWQSAVISHWVLTPEGAKRVTVCSWLTCQLLLIVPSPEQTTVTVPLTATLKVKLKKTGVIGVGGLGGDAAGVELTRAQLVPVTVQPPEATAHGPLNIAVAGSVSAWKQES